jgi:F-type H+-transporting ATPase subunit delta
MSAKKYAKALFEVMTDEGATEAVAADIRGIKKIMKQKNTRDYLADRMVSKKDKMDAFLSCHPLTRGLLNLVIDNKKERQLYNISREYMDMLNRKQRTLAVEVSSCIALTKKEKEGLEQKLADHFKKKVSAIYCLDRKIIGGIYIRSDNSYIDGTVNGTLEGLYASMVN